MWLPFAKTIEPDHPENSDDERTERQGSKVISENNQKRLIYSYVKIELRNATHTSKKGSEKSFSKNGLRNNSGG